VPTYPTVKTLAERGPIGAWAYEARADADLSVEQVAERLTRAGQPVTPSTLRGIEGGSKKPGQRLLRALARTYGKAAPGEPEPAQSSGDIIAAIDRQTAILEQLVSAIGRLDQSVAGGAIGLADSLGAVLAALGGSLPRSEPEPAGPHDPDERSAALPNNPKGSAR
jgi:transcriptional regulator with XRE-family HTH domain